MKNDEELILVAEAESPHRGERLEEHLELSHYIEVFRGSSEYVRRIIVVMLVFSVVMLVAQWNTTGASWIPRRYLGLAQMHADLKHKPEAVADEEIRRLSNGRFASRDELLEHLNDYRTLRIEKVMLVEIPGLGVTFDVNDLGNFCGVAYFIILVLLLLALIREHENLYLALFKVRRLHDRDPVRGDGESKANYLYHALAMSQVFSAPPTLAQWKQPQLKRAILDGVLFVPALVQGYIIATNIATLSVARLYGSSQYVMLPQYAFFVLNVALGVIALFYVEACNHRWKSAFLYVNPALNFINAQPWPLWIKRPTSLPKEPMQRRLWAQAISKLSLAKELPDHPVSVGHQMKLKGPRISYADVVEMCGQLEAMASHEARNLCHGARLISGRITSSVLDGSVWEVRAEFEVNC